MDKIYKKLNKLMKRIDDINDKNADELISKLINIKYDVGIIELEIIKNEKEIKNLKSENEKIKEKLKAIEKVQNKEEKKNKRMQDTKLMPIAIFTGYM